LADYVDVAEARSMPGLRLVLTAGVPGPWGEAAKGLFRVKRMPFVRVRQEGGGPNRDLAEWTGQTSAPVAAWNDERPRTTSTEILFLAERIAADPPLFPARADDRALMLGMSHEVYGELGLGWCRRLMIFDTVLGGADPAATETTGVGAMAVKYGYSRPAARAAQARVAAIVEMLAGQLAREQRRGSRFFIAGQLTALDIYWAAFAAMLEPLPHDVCPMPASIRALYSVTDPATLAALDRRLLEHRDFVYREFLELPLDF
jgi:hypothetical protein